MQPQASDVQLQGAPSRCSYSLSAARYSVQRDIIVMVGRCQNDLLKSTPCTPTGAQTVAHDVRNPPPPAPQEGESCDDFGGGREGDPHCASY
jgi:hypothetical protein